jgi:hypothetical protein
MCLVAVFGVFRLFYVFVKKKNVYDFWPWVFPFKMDHSLLIINIHAGNHGSRSFKKKVHKEDGGYTDVSDRLVNVKENNGQPVIDFIIDIQQVHISYTRPIYSKYIATRMYTSTRLAV